ncbi:MAG: haloacid dehalogenase type, partial [Arthrobacter sp.]|nr:haloacid dehalogenase type [Arthrobacter sp.]
YEYAAAASGVDTASMLLVAVHQGDIHGAARAGLCTARLNRTLQIPDHFETPDLVLTALTDLPAALAAAH